MLHVCFDLKDVHICVKVVVHYFKFRGLVLFFTIRGQVVYVQYSNHPELKTEPSQHSSGVSIATEVASAASLLCPSLCCGKQKMVMMWVIQLSFYSRGLSGYL